MDQDEDTQPLNPEDEISVLARRRREEAERESTEPRPDYVTNVERSEVVYTFDPSALPLANIDPSRFVDSMSELFGLTLAPLDLSPLLVSVPRQQLAEMEEQDLLNRLVRLTDSVIKFESGKFPLHNDFVAIRSISINFESIVVSVAGVTGVAEAVAQDVMELLWKVAGSTKRWDELESSILLVGYLTTTRINLESAPERLVDSRVMAAIAAGLSEQGLVDRIGVFKPSFDHAGHEVSSVFLDDLRIMVSKFNPKTGAANTSRISISVTARNDYGTGRLQVTSELDYENHIALLDSLFGALGDERE